MSTVTVATRRSFGRATPSTTGLLTGWSGARGIGLIAATILLGMVGLLSLALGSAEIDIASVFGAFLAFDGSTDHLIVTELRLPRTLVGVGVGASLALAGVLMQGVTRNPLAEPGILGVNAGAALAVVIAIVAFGVADVGTYVWFALVGALVASAAVYGLGSVGRGRVTPVRLALAGAVLAALLGSATSAVIVLDEQTLDQFRFWVVGSIAGRDLGVLGSVLPFLVVGALVAFGAGRQLNALGLGDETAAALGQRVGLVRGIVSLGVVLLAGGSVAAAGPIAFVGLAVPHAARLLVGADYRWITAYAAVLGPALLIGADILGRVVARPSEVQVGIMTAVIGAPIFIWLVRRSRMAEL